MVYAPFKVKRWREFSKRKISDFESSLQSSLPSYRAFTNNHPYVWGEVDYESWKNEYIKSITIGVGGSADCPELSIRVIEATRSIYLVSGTEQFDWTSLYHYEEWIESNSQVAERIRRFKSTGELAKYTDGRGKKLFGKE